MIRCKFPKVSVKLFLAIILSLSFAVSCFGEDISFEANVNTNKVSLGSILQLTLILSGIQNVSPIEIPEIDGFDSRYVGPSTRVSIVNGHYSSSVAYIYNLFPQKVGTFEIPSLTVTVQGQTYSTKPIQIEVVDTPAASSPSMSGVQTQVDLKDKIFLVLKTSKKKVYVNEKIPVVVRLFVSGLSARDIQLPELELTGFTADNYATPKQYTQTLGGIRYDVVEFDTYVYPTRSGQLSLGPAHLSCNLLYRTSSQPRSPFGRPDSFFDEDFFGDDFFGGFFGGVERRPIVLDSSNVLIDVQSLPEQNRPKHFSGAVGHFDFKVQASPLQVKVGDPITVRMYVSGDGNLRAVQLPEFKENGDFKVYEPQIKEQDGKKILEQVLIPKSEKIKHIPPIEFSYFDPQAQEYKTMVRGPFDINIAKPEGEESFKVVELPGAQTLEPEALGRDLIFIKEKPGVFKPIGKFFYQSRTFFMLIVLSTVFFLVIIVVFRRNQRIKTDIRYARRIRASGTAKKRLIQIRRFMEKGKEKEFYDAIFKTLQEYIGDKFHLSSGGITLEVCEDVLRSKNISVDIIKKVRDVFDECDMVRYASASLDPLKMREIFTKTEEIIDSLERV